MNVNSFRDVFCTVKFWSIEFFFVRCLCSCCFGQLLCSRRVLSGTRQLATSHPFPRVGFSAAEKTQETQEPDLNNWIGMDWEAAPVGHKSFAEMLISRLCTLALKLFCLLSSFCQARARSAWARRACALRALGLLLTDGTPTVGGGKTF